MKANEMDCTDALGVKFMYDRIRELGVPYDNPRWRARCSKPFYNVLVNMGYYLRECGILGDPAEFGECRAILTGGVYVDKPGQHGKGNGFDFDGIMFNNGEVWTYRNDKVHETEGIIIAGMPRKLARRIECAISLFAGVVLTEHYNSRHKDHIHFDIGRTVKWRGSRSQVLVVQAALAYWHDMGLDIDGKIGSRTLLAFNEFMAGVSMSAAIPNKKQSITDERWKVFLDKVARGA